MSEKNTINDEAAVEEENAETNVETIAETDDDDLVNYGSDDDDSPDEEVESGEAGRETISAGRLYDTIRRHPDYRVVEAIPGNKGACHPLKYIWNADHLFFQYDGASRPMHHEAECEEILDLNGLEPLSGERAEDDVYILQDLDHEGWEWSDAVVRVRKTALDTSAKWIKLFSVEK